MPYWLKTEANISSVVSIGRFDTQSLSDSTSQGPGAFGLAPTHILALYLPGPLPWSSMASNM